MQIYDISREFLSAPIFDGDPAPNLSLIQSMDRGDGYNLSSLSACLHTATHIDAPLHFVDNGASIDEIDLSLFMGECDVIACNGFDDDIVGEDETARTHHVEHQVVVLAVLALVCIDVYDVV